MATLRPAVEGDNSNSVLNQIVHGERTHLREYNVAIPIELDAIICRAMETNPQARYATASEFADDLRRFFDGQATAIQHRQFIIEHGESLYDDQHQLAHYWLDLGSILAGAYRDEEAENAYRRSTEQFRELIEQFGRKPHDLCMLAEVLNKTSMLMEKREDLDRAKLYLEQAMVHEQDALRSEPSNADHRKTLVEYQARLDTLNQLPEMP